MKRQESKCGSQNPEEGRRRDRVRGDKSAPHAVALVQRQPDALDVASLEALQRSAGNEAVSSALARVRELQRKANVHDHPFLQRSTYGPTLPIQRKGGTPARKKSGSTKISPPIFRSYTIKATTLAKAAEILNAREEAGETTWEATYKGKTDKDGLVTSATVTVKVKVVMPKWPGAAKLSKAARAEWKRAYRALQEHEQHHVKLVKQHLNGVHERLVGKTEDDAAIEFDAALQELQDSSDAFDAYSDHGRNEGTDLDTSIE